MLATVTSSWKPPGHVFTMRNVAVQAPVGAVVGGVVGGVVTDVGGSGVERVEHRRVRGLGVAVAVEEQRVLAAAPGVAVADAPRRDADAARNVHQASVSPAYCEVEALVTSTSVRATSAPRAPKLDSVCWKMLGSELPLVKWVWKPTQ